MSTSRSETRIPRYVLFYFPSDKTLCIISTKKIESVIEGDKKTKGSKVNVWYGELLLPAEIIGSGG